MTKIEKLDRLYEGGGTTRVFYADSTGTTTAHVLCVSATRLLHPGSELIGKLDDVLQHGVEEWGRVYAAYWQMRVPRRTRK